FSDAGSGPRDCRGHGAAHRIERIQRLFAGGKFHSVSWTVAATLTGDRSLVLHRRNSGEEAAAPHRASISAVLWLRRRSIVDERRFSPAYPFTIRVDFSPWGLVIGRRLCPA